MASIAGHGPKVGFIFIYLFFDGVLAVFLVATIKYLGETKERMVYFGSLSKGIVHQATGTACCQGDSTGWQVTSQVRNQRKMSVDAQFAVSLCSARGHGSHEGVVSI